MNPHGTLPAAMCQQEQANQERITRQELKRTYTDMQARVTRANNIFCDLAPKILGNY